MILVIRCVPSETVHDFVTKTLEPLSPRTIYSRRGRRYIVEVSYDEHYRFSELCEAFANDSGVLSFEVARHAGTLRTGDKARLKKKRSTDA